MPPILAVFRPAAAAAACALLPPPDEEEGVPEGVPDELHAATTEGLAHGLAWAAGHWAARHLLTSLLTDPDDATRLLAEADLDGEGLRHIVMNALT